MKKPIRILLGGSPCTYWSISQKSEKREVENSGLGWELFLNYVIAKDKFNPHYFIYENNESISKKIQKEIERSLGVKLLHLNSSLVSAQTRKRIYATNIPINKEIEDVGYVVSDILDLNFHKNNLINETTFYRDDITYKSNKMEQLGFINKGGQGERVYSINGKSCTLSANGGGKGSRTGLYLLEDEVRKLSPVEAERLQTLPDNYTLCDGVSDTQRYKCIGNGWTANMIIYILQHINIPKDYPLEILSMYDGIATGRYCFEKMGYTNIVYKAYEIDPYAIKIALKNYPDIIQCGDAFKVREDDWKY